MFLSKWFRPTVLDPLSVSMTGAKLGDRILVVGCSDPRLIAALAAKAGMSGRTCAVDESADLAAQAGKVALREGVLIETSAATIFALPLDGESFDLVVIRDAFAGDGAARGSVLEEARRVLRPGGRCMVIDTVERGGISALFADRPSRSGEADETVEALKKQGFAAARTLAEREGLRFVEAVKKNR